MLKLMKALLALSVAVALTLVGGTTANAAGGSERAAAGPCTQQWKDVRKAKRAEDRADQRLTNARKAQKRADGRSEKRAASSKVKKAKKAEQRTDRQLKRAKTAWSNCRDNRGNGGGGGGTGGGGSTATSPIQALCDAGLPQAICDAAAGPAGPGGASPIQALCDAGLPQAICDAAGGSIPAPDPAQLCAIVPIPGLCPGATSPLPLPMRAS